MNGNCEIKMMKTGSLSVGRFEAVTVEESSHTASANRANHKDFNSSSQALSVAVSAAANAA